MQSDNATHFHTGQASMNISVRHCQLPLIVLNISGNRDEFEHFQKIYYDFWIVYN